MTLQLEDCCWLDRCLAGTWPPTCGGDSDSEGGSHLLPSLRLAVEGREGEKKGRNGGGGSFARPGAGMAD